MESICFFAGLIFARFLYLRRLESMRVGAVSCIEDAYQNGYEDGIQSK